MSSSYYAVIGVNHDATQKEIAKAFRAKARVLHPDKLPPTATDADRLRAKSAFQELARAYEVLSDAEKRSQYDVSLPKPSSRESPPNTTGAGSARSRPPSGKSGTRSTAEGGAGARAGSQRAGGQRQSESGQYHPRGAESDWRYSADQANRERERQRSQAEEAAKERERQRGRDGLGAHWVKPKATSVDRGLWEGWKNSGAAAKASFPKDDSDSDTSSVLSFNIGIDLHDLNLDDLEMMDEDDPLGFAEGEVWKIKEPPKSAETHGDTTEGAAGGDAPHDKATQRSRQQLARPCCATQ